MWDDGSLWPVRATVQEPTSDSARTIVTRQHRRISVVFVPFRSIRPAATFVVRDGCAEHGSPNARLVQFLAAEVTLNQDG